MHFVAAVPSGGTAALAYGDGHEEELIDLSVGRVGNEKARPADPYDRCGCTGEFPGREGALHGAYKYC